MVKGNLRPGVFVFASEYKGGREGRYHRRLGQRRQRTDEPGEKNEARKSSSRYLVIPRPTQTSEPARRLRIW